MVVYDKKIFEKPYSVLEENFKNDTTTAMEKYSEKMFNIATTHNTLEYCDNNYNIKGKQSLRVNSSTVNEDIRNIVVMKQNNKIKVGFYVNIINDKRKIPYLLVSETSFDKITKTYTALPSNVELISRNKNNIAIKTPVVLVRGSYSNVNMLGKIGSKVTKGHTEIIDKLILVTPVNQFTKELDVNNTIHLGNHTYLIQGKDELNDNDVLQFTVKLTANRGTDKDGVIVDDNTPIEGIDY